MSAPSVVDFDGMSAFVKHTLGVVLKSVQACDDVEFEYAGSLAVAVWAEIDPDSGVLEIRLQFGVDADLPDAAVDDGFYIDLSGAVMRGKLAPALTSIRERLSSVAFLRLLVADSVPRLVEERIRFEGAAA